MTVKTKLAFLDPSDKYDEPFNVCLERVNISVTPEIRAKIEQAVFKSIGDFTSVRLEGKGDGSVVMEITFEHAAMPVLRVDLREMLLDMIAVEDESDDLTLPLVIKHLSETVEALKAVEMRLEAEHQR